MQDPLMLQRNRGLDKVKQGKEHYNNNQDYAEKDKGYRLFISGLEDLVSYKKQEKSQQLVQQLTQFLSQQFQEADGMKNFLNSIKPQSQQQNQNNGQRNNNNAAQNNNQNLNNNNNHQQNGKPQDSNNNNNQNSNGQDASKIEGNDSEKDKFQQQLEQTIVSEKPNVKWDDVAGLEQAKGALKEAVILPIKFPQIFEGTRTPWKGILLYGPPGTGKTFLAKACATECEATFFSISAADLTSKWVGEGEKLVKTLFRIAREKKPSIIFIDEIDSMTSSREGGGSNESSSRLKTQFLVEMQGVGNDDKGVLVLGATNIPWGLDSAIRRRFEKRIYIPLPEQPARKALLMNLLAKNRHTLNDDDIEFIAQSTEGFSGADMKILITEASYQPLRKCERARKFKQIKDPQDGMLKWTPCSPSDPSGIEKNYMDLNGPELYLPDIDIDDFLTALGNSKRSVGQADLEKHVQFTKEFGMEG